ISTCSLPSLRFTATRACACSCWMKPPYLGSLRSSLTTASLPIQFSVGMRAGFRNGPGLAVSAWPPQPLRQRSRDKLLDLRFEAGQPALHGARAVVEGQRRGRPLPDFGAVDGLLAQQAAGGGPGQ